MTNKIVISDTSCLIAFDRIRRLDILQNTFPHIITTIEVKEEFGANFPEWISICPVQNKSKILKFESIVDRGEASAIVLALETQDCVLIIDEKKGRKLASELHIEIIGTLKSASFGKRNWRDSLC